MECRVVVGVVTDANYCLIHWKKNGWEDLFTDSWQILIPPLELAPETTLWSVNI